MLGVLNEKEEELVFTLLESLEDMPGIVEELDGELQRAARTLRMDCGTDTFAVLSAVLEGLKNLINYVEEVKYGVEHLAGRGLEVDDTSLDCWEEYEQVFEEMLASFEMQDWVGVADLIEYELHPLLEEGRERFIELREALRGINPH
jgi:hypothetical protein